MGPPGDAEQFEISIDLAEERSAGVSVTRACALLHAAEQIFRFRYEAMTLLGIMTDKFFASKLIEF